MAVALGVPAHAAEARIEHGVLESFDGTPIAYTLFFPRDARGFGDSGGEARVDSQQFEATSCSSRYL